MADEKVLTFAEWLAARRRETAALPGEVRWARAAWTAGRASMKADALKAVSGDAAYISGCYELVEAIEV